MEAQIKFAHERLGMIEDELRKHKKEHEKFEAAIAENTKLTKSIAENTRELVDLVKGAKGLRSFVLWVAPLAGVILATWVWLKSQAGVVP